MANSLVQWWRDQNPDDAGLPDQDVTLKIADLAPAYKEQGRDIFAEYPDFAADYNSIIRDLKQENRREFSTVGDEVTRGVKRGYEGMKSTITGAAALAADAIPGTFADPVRDALLTRYRRQQESASADDVAPAVPSYKDIGSVGDAARYVAGLAGEAVPSLAESAATAAIGAAAGAVAGSEVPVAGNVAGGAVGGIAGLVGKQAAKRLIAKKIAGFTAKEIEEAALKGVGSEALKALVKAETKAIASGAGAAIATAINSYGLSAGEIYGDLTSNPNVSPEDAFNISVMAAVPAAALDTVLPSYVIGKSGVLSRIAGAVENFGETEKRGFLGYITRLAAEMPKTATLEGGTEAFQEMVNIAASKYAETKQFPEFGALDWERVVNAAAGGAAGGLVAAPGAAMRMAPEPAKNASADADGEKKKPVEEEKPAEEKPAETAAQPATPADSTTDVLSANYDVNVAGIQDLAARKVSGEDVLAEEEGLKKYPDAFRRYQSEVLKQSEAKVAAAAQTSPPTEVSLPADAGAAPEGGVPGVAPAQPAAVEEPKPASPSLSSEGVFAADGTRLRPPGSEPGSIIQTRASKSPVSIEALLLIKRSDDGSTPAKMTSDLRRIAEEHSIAIGNTDTPASLIEKLKEKANGITAPEEGDQVDKVDQVRVERSRTKLEKLQQEMDELQKKADEASRKVAEAKSLVDRHASASPSERPTIEKQMEPYGGLGGISNFINEAGVIARDPKTGKPTVTILGKKDGRGSVASRLNTLSTAYQAELEKLNRVENRKPITAADVNLDVNKADADAENFETDADEAKAVAPSGYYDINESSDEAQQMKDLSERIAASKDTDRTGAAERLGTLLTSKAHNKRGGSAVSRRITAWVGKDGKVVMSTSHRRAGPNIKNVNQRYRFAVQDKPATEKGASMGIEEMIDAGYRPYASLLLQADRDHGAWFLGSVGEFNSRFADLKTQRDAANEQTIEGAMSDEEATAVDTAQETPSVEVEEEEYQLANDLMNAAVAEAAEKGILPLVDGRVNQAFFKETLVGRMIARHEQIEAAANGKGKLTTAIGAEFIDDLVKLAEKADIELVKGDVLTLANTVPEVVSSLASRLRKQVEKTVASQGKKDSTNEKAEGAGEAGGADVTPAAAAVSADGGGVGAGAGEVPKEAGQANAPAAAPAAGGASQGPSAAAGADLAALKQKVDDRVDAFEEYLYDLMGDEVISQEEYDEALDEVFALQKEGEYAAALEALEASESQFRSRDEADKAGVRSRMAQHDVGDTETVSLADGRLIKPELSPFSIDAIIHNITRLLRPKPQALSQAIGLAEMQARYPDLSAALRRIAIGAAADGTSAGVIRASVAKAMMDHSSMAGVTMSLAENPDIPGRLGKYDAGSDTVSVFLNGHSNEDDLQSTILEESLHAFTVKARMAFSSSPELLSQPMRDAISGIESIIKLARDNGMVWQGSTESPEVAFDEFVAAVVRDGSMQDKLSSIAFEKDFGVARSTNAFDAVVQYIARVVNAMVDRFSELFGIDAPAKRTALDASVDMVKQLIASHERISSSQAGNPINVQRSRFVDGTLGTGGELTVDFGDFTADATAEARRLMALQNQIGDAMAEMIQVWNSKGNNVSSAGAQMLTEDQAIQRLILDVVSSTSPLPSEAKQAINDALTQQGGARVSDKIGIGNLESRSDAPKVAKQALGALYTMRAKLGQELQIARDLFGKKNILSVISSTGFELSELTKKYEDMTFIGKELAKEVRRSINESEDRGAGSIAKAMGMARGRKAALASAESWIRSNLPQFTDAVAALAELGLDPRTTPPADILAQVQQVSATNPSIAPLTDVGRLSMAVQFARRRPLVMHLLATRNKGEAGALRSIINQAMSDRPDAIDIAKRDLGKLTKVGVQAGKIITEIETKKRQHRAMLDRAKLMAEREQFIVDTSEILTKRINKLEQLLQLETPDGTGAEWTAHNGAVYRVPTSPTQPESELFAADAASKEYRKVDIGPEFDGAKVRQDLNAMKAWLDQNRNLRGTPNYALMVRQVDSLAKVYARELDANVKRGPSGLIIRVLGSTADRLDQLGIRGAKEAARMTRQYVAGFEQSLRSVDAKKFHNFDAIMREGVRLTGLHPREFKRLYYNRTLGYLESRQDLLDPTVPTEQQTAKLIDEAIKFIASQETLSPELEANVRSLLRTAAENGEIITGENRRNFGLKVRDVLKGGRVYLREIIGSPLSTAARSIHEDVRAWVYRAKSDWSSTYEVNGQKETKLRAEPISQLYSTDPNGLRSMLSLRFSEEIVTKFLRPLVYKTGKTNFAGPEILGVSDMAKRENLIEAYRRSGGDVIKFAEELHELEGGTDVAAFIGATLATLQGYMDTLSAITDTNGQSVDEDADPGLNFLNARQGEDFPWEWLDYKEYGFQQRTRYLRVMAQQAAFGDGSKTFSAAIGEAKRELQSLKDEYESAQVMLANGDKAGAEAILNKDGLRIARSNAAANLMELGRIEKRHADMMRTINGGGSGMRALSELLGVISGMTVQGFATAATDSVTLIEAPFRKFGFTKEALQFITGTWRALGTEIWGTLAQAFGMDMHQDIETMNETRTLNRMGLADLDSVSRNRGFKALHERYIEELGDELSFSAITQRYQGERVRMARELGAAAATRVARGAKVFLEAGIGQAENEDSAFASLKLLNPFSQGSIWMHRAAARQWLRTINSSILKAEAYFKAHPQDEANPDFRFTHKELGYTGKSLTGLKLDNRAWEYLSEKLAQSGISLEEAARRKMRGADPLTFSQVQAALSLAQTEILLNSSPTTRPAWAMTPGGKLITPLIGWSLYKTADLAKTAGSPTYQRDAKTFISFMEAMLFGVLPVALVYAVLRDEYEEEVLKKKQNVMPLRADSTLPAAVLDATARMGVFGVLGEIPNTIVNQATAREVSIDARVFAVSSLMSLMKVASTVYSQDGTVTYATAVRPFMQAVGGSGYLQNFDAINGLAGLDNIEARMARRINVGNHLRVAGRMNGLEVRTSRGSAVTTNPVRPHVVNMALAAYANDAAGFRRAYQQALNAAAKEFPGSDPYEKVASSFDGMHPLKSVFAARPSTADYQKMLRVLGSEGSEVATAVRNFNAYGQQVLTKRGGSGIKPFTGTETTQQAVDYRTLLTR